MLCLPAMKVPREHFHNLIPPMCRLMMSRRLTHTAWGQFSV